MYESSSSGLLVLTVFEVFNYCHKEVDREITLKSFSEIVLNLIEKVKPSFLLSSMCIFPELNGPKS